MAAAELWRLNWEWNWPPAATRSISSATPTPFAWTRIRRASITTKWRFHLPAVPVPALLPGSGIAHVRSGRGLQPGRAARTLRHSAFHLGHAGPTDAGAHAAAAVHYHSARHRYYAGGRRSILLSNHQVLHREIGRHQLYQRLSEGRED